MGNDADHAELHRAWGLHLSRWGVRIRAWGLEGLVSALLEAAEPLSPLGAQVLYVAQPALGVFVPADRVGRLARLLEDPAAFAWMREQLMRIEPILDEEGSPDGPAD